MEQDNATLFPCKDGFEVICASFSKGPDVIILDTGLSRMNGYQCSRVLKQDSLTRDSAHSHPAPGKLPDTLDRYWSKVCEADAYLTLPVRNDEWKTALGVLKEDHVNITLHGHEPTLSEMIVAATEEPEMVALAREYGAKGIQVAGMCCTGNEILMRHGVPIAYNFLQH